ncbi:MAG: hypothetical protein EHM58_09745 [Ignavibacteriae bacterium]|nr:MAG: hypothetical protein EHM58_09745 [Ignavibacteriota bacterium]
MIRRIFKLLVLTIILHVCGTCSLLSQEYFDTASIIIKKISKERPEFYNISDTYVKTDAKNPNNRIVRVDLEIPETTVLKLTVTDTTENDIINLIDERSLTAGRYRVRWEMENYKPGRYWCEFETDQFVYRKDFFIK